MTQLKYSIKEFDSERMAKAIGRGLPISTKKSVEICNFIRGKSLKNSKKMLKSVIEKKKAVPYKRYNRSIGHKTGKMTAGRYPVKASKEILSVLKSAEANAQFKGLNTSNMSIKHICAQKGSNQMHYGRQRGRVMKRTHIEVVLEEQTKGKRKKESKKKDSKKEKKKEKSGKRKNKDKKKKIESKSEKKKEALKKKQNKNKKSADKKDSKNKSEKNNDTKKTKGKPKKKKEDKK